MTSYRDLQVQLNSDSAGSWDTYSRHRRALWSVMSRALLHLRLPPHLCVLGAGNSNDLDLHEALGVFRRIDLVDWDDDALRQGVARQRLTGDHRVRPFGNIDLRNIDFEGRYEMVVSACVLTQLIDAVVTSAGPDQNELNSRVLEVRNKHLSDLATLTSSGGVAILVTDFVSTDTAEELRGRSFLDMPVVEQLVRARNFFTGCNPFALASSLDAMSQFDVVQMGRPWIWELGDSRSYAVVCFTAFRT